jgi:D-alanine-D-alanine ligase
MTRIGLAYNVKPDALTASDDATHAARPLAGAGALDAPLPFTSAAAHATASLESLDDEFAEWDDAATIDAVEAALAPLGQVIRLEADDAFPARVARDRPDIVFNMAEGRRGPNREAHVPAILEFLGIPCTASDPFTLSLCLDKGRTKETLNYRGIPTAPFATVTSLAELEPLERRSFPMFVKPVHEGSSKGISVRSLCPDHETLHEQVAYLLQRYRQPVLVESYLPGEEFSCALLGNGDDVAVLPIVGMRFDVLPEGTPPIYGFEAKWIWDTAEAPIGIFECPARVDEGLLEVIETIATRAYHAVGCRDWARIDIRLDARGVPNVLDVNPLPGILPDPTQHSCFPLAARTAGIGYDELVQRCLMLGAARQGVEIPSAPTFSRVRRRTPPHGIPLR